jgi:hypothetical protein
MPRLIEMCVDSVTTFVCSESIGYLGRSDDRSRTWPVKERRNFIGSLVKDMVPMTHPGKLVDDSVGAVVGWAKVNHGRYQLTLINLWATEADKESPRMENYLLVHRTSTEENAAGCDVAALSLCQQGAIPQERVRCLPPCPAEGISDRIGSGELAQSLIHTQ